MPLERVRAWVERGRADPSARDPEYIRSMLPMVWMLTSLYFRAEVRGLDRVPREGLFVGNHSGGNMTPDRSSSRSSSRFASPSASRAKRTPSAYDYVTLRMQEALVGLSAERLLT
jgi:hypothetical protein